MNLLRKIPNCAYYASKFKTDGTIFLYDDRIAFDPAAFQASAGAFGIVGAVAGGALANGKRHEIAMCDIARVERHKVMGVNCCIKVSTKNGLEYIYTLWPVRKEIDDIIQLLNTRAASAAHACAPPPAPGAQFCFHCGAQMGEDMPFCMMCGTKVR